MRTIFRRWLAYTPPRGQFSGTVLVILGPILLFKLLMHIGDASSLNTPELVVRALLWYGGLTYLWVVPLVRHMSGPRAASGRER